VDLLHCDQVISILDPRFSIWFVVSLFYVCHNNGTPIFFPTRLLRRIWTDFLDTLPQCCDLPSKVNAIGYEFSWSAPEKKLWSDLQLWRSLNYSEFVSVRPIYAVAEWTLWTMNLPQPMKILIPIDWSENSQKAFNCEWYLALQRLIFYVFVCVHIRWFLCHLGIMANWFMGHA